MKIWLLEDGERRGPYESFVIRDRVEAGELDGGTLVWYEGSAGWDRLDKMPMMRSLFEAGEEEEGPMEVKEGGDVVEALDAIVKILEPPKLYMTRRFFARLFDAVLYFGLILVIFQNASVLPKLGGDLWLNLWLGMVYVLLDAGMTHAWRSSPGKWILGVRVTDSAGHAIGVGGSVMRSLRVWVLGWGMWLIPELSLVVTWFIARRFRYFIWDSPRRYRVVCRPMEWWRVVAMVVGFLAIGAFMNLFGVEEILTPIDGMG